GIGSATTSKYAVSGSSGRPRRGVQKTPKDVFRYARNVVCVQVPAQAAQPVDGTDRKHGAAVGGFEEHHIGADLGTFGAALAGHHDSHVLDSDLVIVRVLPSARGKYPRMHR